MRAHIALMIIGKGTNIFTVSKIFRKIMEFKVSQIAEVLGGDVEGNGEAVIRTFARIENGKPGSICFYANPRYEQYVYGNKVMTNNWFITDGEDALSKNSQASALNYWKKPGDTGCYPKPIAGGSNVWYAGYSTRFLEDGSYLRVKDITVAYTLPENITKAAKLGGIKVYVSALNPYTFHQIIHQDGHFHLLSSKYIVLDRH